MSSLVMNTNAHMSMFLSESLGSSDPIGFSCEGTQSAPYFLRKQREQEIWQPIRSSPNCLADILEECLSLGALAPDPVLPWRDSEDSTLLSGSSSLEDIATTKAAVKALSADELNHVLSFLPVNSFTAAARVRKSWARSIRCTIQLNSTTAEKYFQHGLEIMKTTDSPWESLKLFRRATALNPRLIEAYFWEAKALFILNDWDGAVKTVERALEKQPSPVESLKLRACILYASNDDLRASQLLEVALPLAPNDASIHFELGFCYHGLEQFSKAIECYTTALELNYHRTFVLLANRANCLFRNNNIPEALQDLKASLAINPFYYLALRTRGFVNKHLGNPEAAHQDYTTIIEHSGDAKVKADAYCNRAFCYAEIDEDDMAKAQALDPTNVEIVQYRASALVNQHNIRDAIQLVTLWLAANPAHKDLACQFAFRGDLHHLGGDWEASVRDYDTAAEIEHACGVVPLGAVAAPPPS